MNKILIWQIVFLPTLIVGIYFAFLSIRFMFINGITLFGLMNLILSFIVLCCSRELPKIIVRTNYNLPKKQEGKDNGKKTKI